MGERGDVVCCSRWIRCEVDKIPFFLVLEQSLISDLVTSYLGLENYYVQVNGY